MKNYSADHPGSYSCQAWSSLWGPNLVHVLACSALVLVVIMAAMTSTMVQAVDPDQLQDFCVADLSPTNPVIVNGFPCKPSANVTSKDFLFTGLSTPATVPTTGIKAAATFATVFEYPALNTLGISHARLDFGPGGVIPPHTHPLASETLYVLEGTIYTGFVSYEGVLYAETLKVGDLYVFPKGTIHFQINVGTTHAASLNALTSQDPGLLFVANHLLASNIPDAVLETSLGINATAVKYLQASVPPLEGF
jgi:quercetin dioxygenase-like cupin family protein